MSGATSFLLGWLLQSAIGGGAILLLTVTLMRFCRQPAWRQRLGETGLVAALLLCVFSLGPTWLNIPLIYTIPPSESDAIAVKPPSSGRTPERIQPIPRNSVSEHYPDAHSDLHSVQDEASNADSLSGLSSLYEADTGLLSQERSEQLADAAATVSRVSEPIQTVTIGRASSARAISQLLLLAYASSVCYFLGRWLLAYVGLWRLLQNAKAAPMPVQFVFQEMAERQPVPPRLLVSERISVPASCGIWQPTVVIPTRLCDPAYLEPLRWALAHELTHLERRDARTCLLFAAGQVFFAYLPWFWSLRKQVRLCQEYIADAAAVEAATEPADYAQFLLTLTMSPAVPLGVTGVWENSSDLYRRVTMLLTNRAQLARGCPRWWTLTAGMGLLSLAVITSGISLEARADITAIDKTADTVPDSVKEAAKKDQPTKKKDDPTKKEGIDEPNDFKLAPIPIEGLDPEQARQFQDKMRQMQEHMTRSMQMRGQQGFGFAFRSGGRLGARVQAPTDALIEQLDLTKGQGLVLEQIEPKSAAEKAGLKSHDILLELNGKAVPSDAAKFVTMIDEIKADSAVDAVVLRKGKKETVKGITLPEKKAQQDPFKPFGFTAEMNPLPPLPGLPGTQQFGFQVQPPGAVQRSVITTNFRTDDRFTTRHQEGSLVVTVTGKVADGKAAVSQIKIQDGGESKTYESVDKVPEQYRDKVKNLVETNEKSNIKIEIKTSADEKKPEGK